MMKLFVSALAAIILSFPASGLAGDTAGLIQSTYESMQSFRADFVQVLTNAASGEAQTRTGTISFKQPGLVRWETVEPERELLIVGPKIVWDYFPEEELALKYLSTQLFDSKTMLRFISGNTRLDQDFRIDESPEKDGVVELKLVPFEPEPGLVAATVWVESATGLISGVELVDFYGNRNFLRLNNVRIDPDLPDGDFVFTPPKGTDVQDNTAQ